MVGVKAYRYERKGLERVARAIAPRGAGRARWPGLIVLAVSIGIFCRAESLHGSETAAHNLAARSAEMNRELAGVVAAMAMAGGAMAQDAVQWRIEDGGNGHWYGIRSRPIADMTWLQMRDAALELGGHLITISNPAEDGFAFSYFVSLQRDMIAGPLGLFRSASGSWQWVTGEAVAYTNWRGPCCGNPAAPDNGAMQPFATWIGPEQQASTVGRWEDWSDPELGNPASPYSDFLVEWDADCNSDGIVDFGQIRYGQLIDLDGNNVPDCCEGPTLCQENAVQWRIEDGGNGHWYGWGRVNITDATFLQTRDAAIARGGHLPTVTSAAENTFVFNNIGGALGLYRPPGGAWQHVTGEPVSYFNWNPGAPNGSPAVLNFASYCCHPANTWDDFSDAEIGNPVYPYTDFRIEWDADCNSDGIVDFGQIRDGSLADTNHNNVPDCCEFGPNCPPCPADVVQDNAVNGVDLAAVINAWGTDGGKLPRSDVDGDGIVDGADLAQVLGAWGPCN
jgi:hypothetical protein